MKAKTEELEYGDLVNIVEHEKHITTRFDVVSYLIGFKGVVTAKDWGNICGLYDDGFID